MTWGEVLHEPPERPKPKPAKPREKTVTDNISNGTTESEIGAELRKKYIAAAYHAEIKAVENATEGTRNDQLNKSAFALGRLVAGGEITEHCVVDDLRCAAHACGLGERETESTIMSGMASGAKEPRQVPEPDPQVVAEILERRTRPSNGDTVDWDAYYAAQAAEVDGDGECPPPPEEPDGGDGPEAKQTQERPAESGDPVIIITEWSHEGRLVRYATGIDALDKLCRGGLPFPWRVVIVGAPNAGKTYLLVCIMFALLRQGVAVGILCVDEEPEDVLIRFGMLLGFSQQALEERDPATLDDLREAMAPLPLRLYGPGDTILSAAVKLEAFRKEKGCAHAAFGADSLQAIPPTGEADSPRTIVEANVRDVRHIAHKHHFLTIATSEANRGFYKNADESDATAAMASGAESRAIEFGAKTLVALRTPAGQNDITQVEVPKNRRHHRGGFWLRLLRDDHTLAEVEDPTRSPEAKANREETRRAANKAAVAQDGKTLASLLVQHVDGLGEEQLRAACKLAGLKWGVERLNTAKAALMHPDGIGGVHLVDLGDGRKHRWAIRPVAQEGSE